MIAKVKAGLTDLSVNSFILKVRYIISVIETSAHFPNLPHPAPEIEADINMLAALQGQVVAGNRINVGSRNELHTNIRRKMTANADCVNSLAMGNPAMLETSGFELEKTPVPRGVPSVITKISCSAVQPIGSIKVLWGASKERDFYVLEKRIGEQGTWEEVGISTKVKQIVSGLPVQQYVYFRVAAVNGAGMSMWSDVATAIVG